MSFVRSMTFGSLSLLLLTSLTWGDKTVYHIAVQGSTQLSCKITHKATQKEPYLLINCDYRCDRPQNASWDVKSNRENLYCRGVEGQSPAAIGQPLDSEN